MMLATKMLCKRMLHDHQHNQHHQHQKQQQSKMITIKKTAKLQQKQQQQQSMNYQEQPSFFSIRPPPQCSKSYDSSNSGQEFLAALHMAAVQASNGAFRASHLDQSSWNIHMGVVMNM